MAAHPHPYRPHATHHKYKRQRLAAVLVAVVTFLLWCGRTRPAEAGPQGGDYEPKERVAAHQATQQPQLTIGKVSEEADSAGLDWEAVDSELPAGLVADDDTEGNANSSGGSAKDSVADLAADLASDEVLAELGEGMKGQRQGQEQQQQRAGGGDQGDHQQHVGQPQGMLRPHRQLRCAVVNNRGWHLDVAGGFAWAFQAAGCNVTLYLPDRNIFGIKAVMDSWFTGDHRPVANLLTETAEFDVYAIATFPETHTSALDALMNMKLPGRSMQRRLSQRFLAVVHNADRLMIKAKPARWARFGAMQHVPRDIVQQPDRWPAWQPRRLQLFTLAPFTAQYLAELLQQWSLSSKGPAGIANIAWMPPLAPWLPSFAEGQSAATPGGLGGDISDADGDIFSGSNAHGHLCIQGILDPMRRDYAAAFDALSHPAVLAQLRRHNESLLLLGHVSTLRPTAIVPPHLEPYVRTLSGLPYMEFYDTLARCRAILPAFSSAQYLVSKSSSTTATAINVATPLVAESRVRDAFTFLSPDTLFDYNAPGGEAAPDIPATAKKDAHLYTWMDASVMLAGGGLAPEEVWTAEDEARQQQQRRQMSEGEDGAGDRDAAEVEPGSLGVDPDGPSSGEEADGTAANASLMQLRHLGQGDGEEGAGRQVQAGDAGSSGLLGGQAWAKKELDDGTEPELQLGREVAPDGQLGEPEHAAATALPEPGSYAHALLQLFEPGASSAAHAATRKLKAHLMQRNKEVAAQFLAETVQLMAAVDAKFQAEDGAESAWQ